ncbi:major capsid protein [Microbacterium sp. BG28]|uniref:major capsid protein n=1 Tax=Microbacterium sp. BG28 TaxID=3097356 RepID=UPI002A5A51A0|nr:major capsid protein [Microbacterium sp. BG28]MDY0829129.1 major capsid protein [Microbacterium sp. BG28]
MGFTKNFRSPVQLTGVARAAFDAQISEFLTDSLLPVNRTYDINFSFGVAEGALPPAAQFRSFNTAADVGTTDDTEQKSGKLPPLSRRIPVDEFQQLQMYNASADQVGQKFEEYATRIARSFALRFVLAQAEAVTTGKVTIAERNLSFTVDYGRRANLTAPAATVWSNTAASDPITDLEGMRKAYKRRVGRIVVSRLVMGYLQANAQIIKTFFGRGTDLPTRISEEQVRSVFSEYGLGQLVVNEDVLVNASGAEVPLFAEDKVILLPSAGPIGRTDLGVTAESIRQDTGIAQAERAGLFAGAIEADNPSGYDVLVSGIGLPILTDPNNTAVLDVA